MENDFLNNFAFSDSDALFLFSFLYDFTSSSPRPRENERNFPIGFSVVRAKGERNASAENLESPRQNLLFGK